MVLFGFDAGVELRSSTHWGGGGGAADMSIFSKRENSLGLIVVMLAILAILAIPSWCCGSMWRDGHSLTWPAHVPSSVLTAVRRQKFLHPHYQSSTSFTAEILSNTPSDMRDTI